jgi:hypothetical protein
MTRLPGVAMMFVVALLSACGGGSSSGGGGAEGTASTYNGTETLTITFLGEKETGTAPITIVVDQAGTVTVTDSQGTVHTGTLNGSSFTATGKSDAMTDPAAPGVSCSTSQSYKGVVNGENISGTTSGTLQCSDGSSSFNGTAEGTFEAALAQSS